MESVIHVLQTVPLSVIRKLATVKAAWTDFTSELIACYAWPAPRTVSAVTAREHVASVKRREYSRTANALPHVYLVRMVQYTTTLIIASSVPTVVGWDIGTSVIQQKIWRNDVVAIPKNKQIVLITLCLTRATLMLNVHGTVQLASEEVGADPNDVLDETTTR